MPSKPRNLPADERRAATVEAVVDLAAERNPSEITTAAIAKRMNLTQGALFRHFSSKDAIWQAVITWVAQRLLARVDRAIETATSPVSALEAVFMSHIEFVAAHPGVPRMIFGELQHAEGTVARRMVRTLLERYGERLVTLIEDGKEQGLLAREVDTAASVTLFIGTIQGLVMQSLLAGNADLILAQAPAIFAIYSRAIRKMQ